MARGSPSDLVSEASHRPWAVPQEPWLTEQNWADLLFAHWPLPPALIRNLVPAPLQLDTCDGSAWISVTSFLLRLRFRGLPFPFVRSAPELNVRTYVTVEGKPGVFFFSLDIASLPAVIGARAFYRLPYYRAAMQCADRGVEIHYRTSRLHGPRPASFVARYQPVSEPRAAVRGSLEYFLAERYCLYTVTGRQVHRTDIHHRPWPLQEACAEIVENSMAAAAGVVLPAAPPITHFSRELDVLVWRPRRVELDTRQLS